MTLNASGPISLGGATTGQSINVELGQSSTATVSLNDTNVRGLAGVPSGTITMPTNFWGRSAAYKVTLTGVSISSSSITIPNDLVVGCDRNVVNTTKPTTTSYICANNSGALKLYRSQDRGNNWSQVFSGTTGLYMTTIDGKAQSTSASTFCALMSDTTSSPRTFTLYRSTNSGGSWGTVSLPAFSKDTDTAAICANQYPGSTEWMAVIGPTTVNLNTAYVIRSTDSGASWSVAGTFTTTVARGDISQIFIACSNDASTASRWMISIDSDGIFTSTNSGASWTQSIASSRIMQYQSLSYGNGIWICCQYPQIGNASTMGYSYSTNNGSSWTFVQYPNAGTVNYTRNFANYVEDYVSGGGYFAFSASTNSGGNYYITVFISTTGTSITNTPSFSGTWGPGYTNYQAPVASYGPMIGPGGPESGTTAYCIVPS